MKNSKEIRGLGMSISLGKRLQNDIPEIADAYREGMSYRKIAEHFEIDQRYGVTPAIAKNAVQKAISGTGEKFRPHYKGLIEPAELEDLLTQHRSKHGRDTFEQKIGCHSLDHEDYVALGKKLVEDRKGIHSQTRAQRSFYGKKGAHLGVIARGRTPWTTAEEKRALELAKHPDYQKANGIWNYKIAAVLNEEHHQGRNVRKRKPVGQKIRQLLDEQ